jgi:hypothetical protein
MWSPKQIALFESAICKFGKEFDAIKKIVNNNFTQFEFNRLKAKQ